MERVAQIIDFWFQGVDDGTRIDKRQLPFRQWFTKDPVFDDQVRSQFEQDLLRAERGVYLSWEETMSGRLALILLYDQFSRNMYRGHARMVAYDALARDLVARSLAEKRQGKLSLIQQVFLCMPLMHAEDLEPQRLSVVCFKEIKKQAEDVAPFNVAYFDSNVQFARRHYDIIKRFGRFPHRNVMLGRTSTSEEKTFLEGPRSSF